MRSGHPPRHPFLMIPPTLLALVGARKVDLCAQASPLNEDGHSPNERLYETLDGLGWIEARSNDGVRHTKASIEGVSERRVYRESAEYKRRSYRFVVAVELLTRPHFLSFDLDFLVDILQLDNIYFKRSKTVNTQIFGKPGFQSILPRRPKMFAFR